MAKIVNAYFGVDDTAKQVSKIYVGDGGVAKQVFPERDIMFITSGSASTSFLTYASLYSYDGITWETGSIPFDAPSAMVCGNGRWLVFSSVSSGGAATVDYAYSDDGLTWTQSTFTPSGTSSWYTVQKAIYANGVFVVIVYWSGTYSMWQSTDGVVWAQTPVTTSAGALAANNIVYGGGRYVVYGSGRSAYSTDLINWTEGGALQNLTWQRNTFIYAGDRFLVATGYQGTMNPQQMGMSTDGGVTWTVTQIGMAISGSYWAMAYGNGVVVYVGTNQLVVGLVGTGLPNTWSWSYTSVTNAATSSVGGIVFVNGLFYTSRVVLSGTTTAMIYRITPTTGSTNITIASSAFTMSTPPINLLAVRA